MCYRRTKKKNHFLVSSIKAIIILKNNFKKYSCNDFLFTQPKLLNAISSSKKYGTTNCSLENDEQLIHQSNKSKNISTILFNFKSSINKTCNIKILYELKIILKMLDVLF